MSLPHALLTSLSEQPGSGSELARRFDRSIGYFWQATHQQIYRELARLEAAGWIQALPADGGRGRQRRYQILAAGHAALKQWTEAPQAPSPIRDELMVRLRAEAVVGPTRLKTELVRLADMHRQKLAKYQAIEARDFTPSSESPEKKLQHLVLKSGISYESHRLALCDEALAILGSQDERITHPNRE
ncbi:PadR family transcriptional regulator [Brevundimonas vesicularis]|uniref:PadR family transcriptional regulator n=1 Tax=Brevundimonas vesicularis TaxID=41276 RepID=UPI0038D4163D